MAVNIEKQANNIIEASLNRVLIPQIVRTMKKNAPVYTGRLRDSIRAEKVGKWHWIVAPHVVNSRGEDYAYYAEHGNHANSSDGLIHVKNAKWMPITDKDGSLQGFAKAVKPHKATNFVKNTAEKYRLR